MNSDVIGGIIVGSVIAIIVICITLYNFAVRWMIHREVMSGKVAYEDQPRRWNDVAEEDEEFDPEI